MDTKPVKMNKETYDISVKSKNQDATSSTAVRF